MPIKNIKYNREQFVRAHNTVQVKFNENVNQMKFDAIDTFGLICDISNNFLWPNYVHTHAKASLIDDNTWLTN